MPTSFVPYNDKSSAKRGLVRKSAGLKGQEDHYLSQRDGKWGFLMDDKGPILAFEEQQPEEPEVSEPEPSAPTPEVGVFNQMHGDSETPDDQRDAAVEHDIKEGDDEEAAGPSPSAFAGFAFAQLTSRHSLPEPTEAPVPPAPRAPTFTKVEKNRPEQNNVKRPSAGTVCARVWDLASSMSELSESGGPHTKVATLSAVIKAAEAIGINKFTARTQYARWRVFNGITGRLS